jgi:hypothetical protein
LTVALPGSTFRSRRALAALLIIAIALVAAVILGIDIAQSVSVSAQQRATQTGLDYSRTTMVWGKGPSVASSRIVALDNLNPALRSVHLIGGHDINTADLIRQYGAKRQVDLVVLHGTFNTLAPDEGVNITSDVVVLVDMKTRHVLFMND